MTSQHRLSRKNRKSKHHSLRDGRAATNNSSSDNEVFEMKHKKGRTLLYICFNRFLNSCAS